MALRQMRALSVFISCSHLFSLQNKLRTNRSTACTSNTYCYRLVILTTSFMQFANNSLLLILIAIFLFLISFHFILSYRFSITSSDVFDGISYNIVAYKLAIMVHARLERLIERVQILVVVVFICMITLRRRADDNEVSFARFLIA